MIRVVLLCLVITANGCAAVTTQSTSELIQTFDTIDFAVHAYRPEIRWYGVSSTNVDHFSAMLATPEPFRYSLVRREKLITDEFLGSEDTLADGAPLLPLVDVTSKYDFATALGKAVLKRSPVPGYKFKTRKVYYSVGVSVKQRIEETFQSDGAVFVSAELLVAPDLSQLRIDADFIAGSIHHVTGLRREVTMCVNYLSNPLKEDLMNLRQARWTADSGNLLKSEVEKAATEIARIFWQLSGKVSDGESNGHVEYQNAVNSVAMKGDVLERDANRIVYVKDNGCVVSDGITST